uniref:Uncharacterized protein n=1 Tax=Arundo donax TaxID=35708 RepID=A0A0A8Y947_ARUDO
MICRLQEIVSHFLLATQGF